MIEREKAIQILSEAYCDDPHTCSFGLCGYDENYNVICNATDPPSDPYDFFGEGCPFCKQIAELLKEQKKPAMRIPERYLVAWGRGFDDKDGRMYPVPFCGKCGASLTNKNGIGYADVCPKCKAIPEYYDRSKKFR